MSPIDELRMFGWALGAGIFLSLLMGLILRWHDWRQRPGHPINRPTVDVAAKNQNGGPAGMAGRNK